MSPWKRITLAVPLVMALSLSATWSTASRAAESAAWFDEGTVRVIDEETGAEVCPQSTHHYAEAIDPRCPVERAYGTWDGKGPWGGNVRALLTSPHDPTRILCACGFSWATEAGGVWISNSGGTDWQDTGLANRPVYGLASSPAQPGVYYAAVYDGLYRSLDAGLTWTRIALAGQFVLGAGVKVNDGNILIAGLSSNQGLRRSTDGGVTWNPVGLSQGFIKGYGTSTLEPERMYVAMSGLSSAVYRSDNGGESWTPSGPSGCSGYGLYVTPDDADRVFVTVAVQGTAGIYRTLNGGESWVRVLDGVGYAPVVEHDGVLYAAIIGQGIFESTDGGDSWAASSAGIVADFWQAGAAGSAGVLFGHWGGVYRSGGARTPWVVSQEGLDDAFVYAVAYYADLGQLWAGTDESGLWCSGDGGQTWELRANGLADWGISGIAPADHHQFQVDRMIVATGDGVFRSDDHGASWTRAGLAGTALTSVAIHWSDPQQMWAGKEIGGVMRSANGGATWLTGTGLPAGGLYPEIELVPLMSGTRVLVAYQQSGNGAVYYSDDGGASYLPGTGLESASYHNDLSVRLSSTMGDGEREAEIAYCATDRGIFRSYDSGVTWEHAGSFYSLCWSVMGTQTADVYAGSQGAGVYRSEDEGDTWVPYNQGIEGTTVWGLVYGPTHEYVFAGLRGRGVRAITEDLSHVRPGLEPLSGGGPVIRLSPNPFQASSWLHLSGGQVGTCELRVCDASGRIVWTERLPISRHGLTWQWPGTDRSGRPLPGGTYFVAIDGSAGRAASRWVILR